MEIEVARKVLDSAILQAEKSWNEGGIPIGAALSTSEGMIIALGHNQRVQTGDPTAHAETVCFRNAGRRRDWSELVLVSTLSPCSMCTGTALLYGVKKVVIGENTTFMGAEHWLEEHGIETHVLHDPRCIELMRRLQKEKPDLWAEDIGQ